jgi:hypothetical protein
LARKKHANAPQGARKPARSIHLLDIVRALICLTLAAGGLYLLPGSLSSGQKGIPLTAAFDCESGGVLASHGKDAALEATRIDESRFRVGGTKSYCFGLRLPQGRKPLYLMLRPGPGQRETTITISAETVPGQWTLWQQASVPASGERPSSRTLVALPSLPVPPRSVRVALDSAGTASDARLVVEEIALWDSREDQKYAERSALRLWAQQPEAWTPLFWLTVAGVASLCFRPGKPARWLVPVFAVSLALPASALALRQRYSGPEGYDFRVAFANNHLESSNLSESIVSGARILQGKGNTFYDGVTPGSEVGQVNAYRMPGYATFIAIAGMAFGAEPTEPVSMGEATVRLHVAFYFLSLAALTAALPLVLSLPVSTILAGLLCWFPQSFDLTQGDSIILYCGFVITAALCVYLHRQRSGGMPSLAYHIAVHAAFALFLTVRSDVLVGWAAVSLFLYWRRWRYLAIPATFVLAICGGWGLYKMAYGGRFAPTTTNVGHVAFVGLWQVPEHRFAWEPTDASYDTWIKAHGYRYFSVSANSFATREIVRFWFTYPAYTASAFWHKFYKYFRWASWSGSLTPAYVVDPGTFLRAGAGWVFAAALLLALLARYEATRTFLLGWPVFFNLPLFCLMQESGGRFVAFASCSIVIAAIPLVVDMKFYQAMWKRVRWTAPVAVVAALLWMAGPRIDEWMLQSPGFRYATPFLDPARSTLNVTR